MTTWKTRNASQRPSRPGNPETSTSLPVSAFDRPLARGKSCRGQLTLSQLWSHWSAEPACCYRCWMVILDHPGATRRPDAGVSFQDDHCVGPRPSHQRNPSAWPNQNVSELRGKNPPLHTICTQAGITFNPQAKNFGQLHKLFGLQPLLKRQP